MIFRVFYQLRFGGNYYEDVEAISPHKAIDKIKSEHNHAIIISVFDSDGNRVFRNVK